jgi:hypothetical protein
MVVFYAFNDENRTLLRYYSGIAKTAFFQTCKFVFCAPKQQVFGNIVLKFHPFFTHHAFTRHCSVKLKYLANLCGNPIGFCCAQPPVLQHQQSTLTN